MLSRTVIFCCLAVLVLARPTRACADDLESTGDIYTSQLGGLRPFQNKSAPDLYELLDAPEIEVVAGALAELALRRLPAGEAGPHAAKFLEHQSAKIRYNALLVVGNPSAPYRAAKDAVVKRLSDPHRGVRYAAVDALRLLGELGEESRIKIRRLADDESAQPCERRRAAFTLLRSGTEAESAVAIEIIKSLLALRPSSARNVPPGSEEIDLCLLGNIYLLDNQAARARPLVPTLLELLKHRIPLEARTNIAADLGSIGDRGDPVVRALCDQLKYQESPAAMASVAALGKLGLTTDACRESELGAPQVP